MVADTALLLDAALDDGGTVLFEAGQATRSTSTTATTRS